MYTFVIIRSDIYPKSSEEIYFFKLYPSYRNFRSKSTENQIILGLLFEVQLDILRHVLALASNEC